MYERTYNTRVLKQEEKPQKKKRFSWKKLFISIGVLLVVCGIGYALRYSAFQVRDITVVGTTVLDSEDIQTHVRHQLEGTRLWLFPRTSIFLVYERGLEASLKKTFSRIETVAVKRTSFHSLQVSIQEFQALYVWCSNDDTDCYFMDKQGMVYSTAPVFSGTAYPKIISHDEIRALPFQAMDIREVARISLLEQQLSAINIIPATFTYVSPKEIDIDFLHNKSTAIIKIDPAVETDTTLEYIFSGIRTEPLASLFHSPVKKLEYIDVRFPSKVVYKFE